MTERPFDQDDDTPTGDERRDDADETARDEQNERVAEPADAELVGETEDGETETDDADPAE